MQRRKAQHQGSSAESARFGSSGLVSKGRATGGTGWLSARHRQPVTDRVLRRGVSGSSTESRKRTGPKAVPGIWRQGRPEQAQGNPSGETHTAQLVSRPPMRRSAGRASSWRQRWRSVPSHRPDRAKIALQQLGIQFPCDSKAATRLSLIGRQGFAFLGAGCNGQRRRWLHIVPARIADAALLVSVGHAERAVVDRSSALHLAAMAAAINSALTRLWCPRYAVSR